MKFFRVPFNHDDEGAAQQPNQLHEYIQSQSMQDMARLASEISPQVKQIIAGNVQALLGYLPGQEFQTTVAAEKGSLQNLLASAMVTGYFMHAMENRMKMESLFTEAPASSEEASEPVFGPEPAASSAEVEPSDTEGALQNGLQQLIKTRLEEAQRRKNALKNPEELFGALIERHLKDLEDLDDAERLGEFVSGEALQRLARAKANASSAAPVAPKAKGDTVKIQVEINTELGQKALTDLLRTLGTTMGRNSET